MPGAVFDIVNSDSLQRIAGATGIVALLGVVVASQLMPAQP